MSRKKGKGRSESSHMHQQKGRERREIKIYTSAFTFKALLASAPVSIHQIVTSSSVLAWIRKAFISVHFTVDANPACITEALVSERRQNYLLLGDECTIES